MRGWIRSCWRTRSATRHPAQIRELSARCGRKLGRCCTACICTTPAASASPNALAGLEEGIRAFDSCLAGLGGCPYAPGASGNVVTEDLVFMLESMGFTTGIDLENCLRHAMSCMPACPQNH